MCPGVILPQSGRKEEEIDLVLPGKAMRTRQKSPQYGLEKVHVRAGGREYPCVLREVRMNVKNFIEKVYFQEYVPGKANRIKVPLFFSNLEQNRFFQQSYDYGMEVNFVYILCYNN